MTPIPQYSYFEKQSSNPLRVAVVRLQDINSCFSTNKPHSLSHYEICLISKGKGFFTLGHQTHFVKSQDVLFSVPGEARKWDSEKIKRGLSLIFEGDFIASFFQDPDFLPNLTCFSDGQYTNRLRLDTDGCRLIYIHLLHLRKKILEARDIPGIRALLYQVLIRFHQAYRNEYKALLPVPQEVAEAGHPLVNDFLDLAHSYALVEHQVGFYANWLGVTSNHLHRTIKKSINITAQQYIRNLILQEAKRRLLDTDMPIAAIASALHFRNASEFIRFFRHHVQHTPAKYRVLARKS
jgi:AraC-like DNA-binding protein